MKLRLPRYAKDRELAALIEPAATFAVSHRDRDIEETLDIKQAECSIAFSYAVLLLPTRQLRTLALHDYAEFARRLGLFEHYEFPMLLSFVHEGLGQTVAPHLVPWNFDPTYPTPPQGSPFGYYPLRPEKSPIQHWDVTPMRRGLLTADLTIEQDDYSSRLTTFATQLWDGSRGVTLSLPDPQVPQEDPEASTGNSYRFSRT